MIEGHFYRVVGRQFAFSISDAGGSLEFGGRYNKKDLFPCLYLADSEATCWSELARKSGGLEFLPPSAVGTFSVSLGSVLDLTDPHTLEEWGVSPERLLDPLSYSYARAIAERAREAGYEALLAPSATGKGEILAVFVDCLRPASHVTLLHSEIKDPSD